MRRHIPSLKSQGKQIVDRKLGSDSHLRATCLLAEWTSCHRHAVHVHKGGGFRFGFGFGFEGTRGGVGGLGSGSRAKRGRFGFGFGFEGTRALGSSSGSGSRA